jgi:hypothetical protein
MNLPKWYITALKNKQFYESDEYRMLLNDAIKEYNKAFMAEDREAINKWKELILKWLNNKETNRFMLMQVKI